MKIFTRDLEVSITKWSVKNAVTRLKSLELIYSPERGKLEVENYDFRDYILEKQPCSSIEKEHFIIWAHSKRLNCTEGSFGLLSIDQMS